MRIIISIDLIIAPLAQHYKDNKCMGEDMSIMFVKEI